MGVSDDTEFAVLHTVKIRGFATADQVAASCGLPDTAVTEALEQAKAAQHVRFRDGRITGYLLTTEGKARHEELRKALLSDDDLEQLDAVYRGFLEPNRAFKKLTTEWQLRTESDSTDELLARLRDIHATVTGLVEKAATVQARYTAYPPRFTRALSAIEGGDGSAFARPMSDSYHDVWMELHEDLLSILALQRSDADE